MNGVTILLILVFIVFIVLTILIVKMVIENNTEIKNIDCSDNEQKKHFRQKIKEIKDKLKKK
jgi:uncharacterized membrane protein